MALDLELRSSDLAEFSSRSLLEALVLQVSFDQENVMDALLTGDLSQNAQLDMVNITGDKRAMREARVIYVGELTFDSAYEFRIYSINDVL